MLKVLNRLTEHEPFGIVNCQTSTYCVHLGQQPLYRPFAAPLQGVVYTADDSGPVSRRVFHRIAHHKELAQVFADVQAAAYCLKIVYGIRLLKRVPEMRPTVRRISDKKDTLLNVWILLGGGRALGMGFSFTEYALPYVSFCGDYACVEGLGALSHRRQSQHGSLSCQSSQNSAAQNQRGVH